MIDLKISILLSFTSTMFACASGERATSPAQSLNSESKATPPRVETASDASAKGACSKAGSSEFNVGNSYGTLVGTLALPEACAPIAVALIIPGSGGADRNGNAAKDGSGANMYALLAEALQARGIASVRYDKAGVGASASARPKREDDFRFEFGADDAARFVTKLRADRRFDRVVVVGHSEGALLGLLAAQQAKLDAYVSIAGPGRPVATVLREQIAAQIDDAALLKTSNQIITSLEAGQTVAETPKALDALFRPSVQPYLISWMKYDPAQQMRQSQVKTLIVQGTTDIQVKVEDAKLLAAARPDARIAIVEGMNHALKTATLAAESQAKAYTNPALPLAEGLLDALAPFVKGRP
jgi:uncharacterized protein